MILHISCYKISRIICALDNFERKIFSIQACGHMNECYVYNLLAKNLAIIRRLSLTIHEPTANENFSVEDRNFLNINI